ncbi:RNA polymerase sigma factor [Rhizobium halophilum]|uniref:RNA polymerase sigma factor n=1 Tax=Rhizobium halophilum TaxID=2846852 RepID=UPI001EFE9228|nr:RNA polymerase sigma factor [Rhizobium halophilum]MCF6367431.1 RNA polymerase sigma factor [Rhizobium halophilum]
MTSGASPEIRRHIVSLLPRLRRFAQTLPPSVEAADECVRSACTRAITGGRSPSQSPSILPWLFALVRSAASLAPVCPTKAPEVSDASRSSETEQQAIVLGLPAGEASAFLLVEVEGFTYAEAADILGVDRETLVLRLYEARVNFAAIAAPTVQRRA